MIQFYRGRIQPLAAGGWFYFKTYNINLEHKPTPLERIALTLEFLLNNIKDTQWEQIKFKLDYVITKQGCLIKTDFSDPAEGAPYKLNKPASYRLTLKRKVSKRKNLKLDLIALPDIKSFLTHEIPEVRKLVKKALRDA